MFVETLMLGTTSLSARGQSGGEVPFGPQQRLGRALKGKRDRAILMTKVGTHGRDKNVAMRQLEESLTRLQTDRLDVWQIHEVTYENPFDTVQMPLNCLDATFRGFETQVLPEVNRRGIAALEMQAVREAGRLDAADGHLELFKTTKKYDGDLDASCTGSLRARSFPREASARPVYGAAASTGSDCLLSLWFRLTAVTA
jgi:hypothetical protein